MPTARRLDGILGTFDLSGRVALVTGASRGIGRAIAIGLAQAGADILVHYATDLAAAHATADEVVAQGRRARIIAADFTRPGAGAALAAQSTAIFGQVDIVVLNAARSERQKFLAVDAPSAARQVSANFLAGFEMLQALLPQMAVRRWGRVVTIGSVQQVRPNPGLTVYAAMKAAQFNLVVNLARQYSKDGVTVNNVAPGMIDTDATAVQIADPATISALLDEIPARSVGTVSDCVGPVLLLCSDAGRYITGINLFVDGGMHLPGPRHYVGPDGHMERS